MSKALFKIKSLIQLIKPHISVMIFISFKNMPSQCCHSDTIQWVYFYD